MTDTGTTPVERRGEFRHPLFARRFRPERVVVGLSFPTSLTFDEAGAAYVAESGLPFGGAEPGGRIWRLERDGNCTLLLDGLRPPVNGLTWHEGSLYISEGGHPGRIRRTDGPRGERPPEPMVVPLHAVQNLAGLVGIVGAGVAGGLLIKRALRGDDEPRTSGEARQRVLKEKKKLLLAWLNDAYAMEKALIPILEHHARDARDYPHIRARDLDHLEQTRHHADLVKGCIERLGESPSTTKTALGSLIGTMNSVATGPFEDELVKNFLSDYAAEHLEIASYKALIAAAQEVGDRETALVCEQILWEEEDMARWLEENLPMAVRETLRK